MKKFMFIIIMLAGSTGLYAQTKNVPVSILSTKRDVFYFKVDKILLGAVVEVYSSTGEMIFTAKVTHRRAIIDFYTQNSGTYSIKLKKDDRVEEFTYMKESDSPLVSGDRESASASIILAR